MGRTCRAIVIYRSEIVLLSPRFDRRFGGPGSQRQLEQHVASAKEHQTVMNAPAAGGGGGAWGGRGGAGERGAPAAQYAVFAVLLAVLGAVMVYPLALEVAAAFI